MKLTLFALQNAKPRDKPYRLPDGHGLALQIETNGSKLWRFRYRFLGKAKMLSFGAYPNVTLLAAREQRDAARKLLREGQDPSVMRQTDKLTARTTALNTFGVIANEYLSKLREEGRSESTIEKNEWLLNDLASDLKNRPAAEIKPSEILSLLKRVEKSGRRETAHRLRGIIGSVYRFAIANLKAETDPTYALRGSLLKKEVTHRAAITDELKLGRLMCAIDEYDGWPTLRAALLLLPLTMARPGEVRLMQRSEINWIKATWSIPESRTKMRRPHDVPLSRQALEVLRSVWGVSQGTLVFPSIRSNQKPLSDNALNSALRRMGYTSEEMTAHGFRSSASTILNERGYEPDVIETALAHIDDNEVRRAYNRAKYWQQRVKLLQDWADLLDHFRTQKLTSVSI